MVWRGVIRSWVLTIDDKRMLVAYPSKPQFTTESAGRPPCAIPVLISETIRKESDVEESRAWSMSEWNLITKGSGGMGQTQ